MAENKSVLQKLKEPDYRRNFLTGAVITAGGVSLLLQGIPADRNGIIGLTFAAMTIGIIYAEQKYRQKTDLQ